MDETGNGFLEEVKHRARETLEKWHDDETATTRKVKGQKLQVSGKDKLTSQTCKLSYDPVGKGARIF